MKILQENDSAKLIKLYETAVKECLNAKVSVEDELSREKGVEVRSVLHPKPVFSTQCFSQTDHLKRTHDYEPFLCEFVKCLHAEGLVDVLIDQPKAKKPATNGKPKQRKKVKLGEDANDGGTWEP